MIPPAGSERRVREVILTAPDQTTAQRGSILLEDALHTASIPGANGRFLLIRNLDVGRISPRASSTSLSLQIEKKLRHLAATALPAGHPRSGTAPAVFFPNRTEAVVRLALRLAKGWPTREWYWPLAVPTWRPDAGQEANLRRLLFALAQEAGGPAAVVSLVTTLLTESAIEPLLAALTAADGTALVQFFGWQPAETVEQPAVFISNTAAPNMPTLPPVVRTWLRRWPPGDNRAIWLAGMVLAGRRLSRLHTPQLGRRARLVALHAAREIVEPGLNNHSLEIKNTPKPIEPTLDSPPDFRSTSEIANTADKMETAEKSPPTSQRQEPVEIPATKHLVGTNEIPAPLKPNRLPPQPAPIQATSNQVLSSHIDRTGAEKVQKARFRDLFQEMELLPPKTGYGGLFLLLPLLAHLGIADWMQDEQWLEAAFPQRFLNLLCQRLHVPEDDPIWQAVTVEPDPVSSPDFFLAPAAWGNELVSSGRQLSRVKQDNHNRAKLRVMVDSSGHMPLAAWHGRTPQIVRRRLLNQSCVRGQPLQPTTILELALKSWLTAVRRWCRRYAQIGLYDLICRPGHLDLTPTHLDLFFDISQVDIRIRRTGLDVNPGWLPWFGQVVTFHYLDAQEVYV